MTQHFFKRVQQGVGCIHEGFAEAFDASGNGIKNEYLTGLSLTHDSAPQKHIWPFVVAETEDSIVTY